MASYLIRVEALMTAIAPILREDIIYTQGAEGYARAMLEYSDDNHFEVRASHTRSGVPFTCTIPEEN